MSHSNRSQILGESRLERLLHRFGRGLLTDLALPVRIGLFMTGAAMSAFVLGAVLFGGHQARSVTRSFSDIGGFVAGVLGLGGLLVSDFSRRRRVRALRITDAFRPNEGFAARAADTRRRIRSLLFPRFVAALTIFVLPCVSVALSLWFGGGATIKSPERTLFWMFWALVSLVLLIPLVRLAQFYLHVVASLDCLRSTIAIEGRLFTKLTAYVGPVGVNPSQTEIQSVRYSLYFRSVRQAKAIEAILDEWVRLTT